MTNESLLKRAIRSAVPAMIFVGAICPAIGQNAPNQPHQQQQQQPQQQNPPPPNTGLEKQVNAGALQRPIPYAGTKTIGNPPVAYTGSTNPTDPLTYWKSRIISTGNGCGTTVIIVGGAPCYVPLYYGLGGY